jgi:hypothetical protein
VRASFVGAAHQVKRDGVVVVGKSVELEPEHVRRNRGDLLDRGIAGRCQHVGMRRRCASAANSFSAPGHIRPAEPIGATPIGAAYLRPNSSASVAAFPSMQ